MKINFDIRGNLKPYERIKMNLEDFKENFVTSFGEDSTRHLIFETYEKFIQNFNEKISGDFRHWINGSFVSNKKNPKDIDFVNLVDYQIVETKEVLIKREFIKNAISKNQLLDAYLLILYPKSHKLRGWTNSDLLYWNDWFTNSKMNKQRKRSPKGYIEINFG